MRLSPLMLILGAMAACGSDDAAPAGDPTREAGTEPGAESGSADTATATNDGGPVADSATADRAADVSAGVSKYGQDGALTVTTFAASVTNGSSTFTEHGYVPSSAGLHPVVSLSPGLQQPAAAYVS